MHTQSVGNMHWIFMDDNLYWLMLMWSICETIYLYEYFKVLLVRVHVRTHMNIRLAHVLVDWLCFTSHVMTIQNKPTFKKKGSSWKKKKKGKAKVANPKPNPTPKAKPGPAADKECFHCHQSGLTLVQVGDCWKYALETIIFPCIHD